MLLPHGTLILVADGGRSRILRNIGTDTAPDLRVIEQRQNCAAAKSKIVSAAGARTSAPVAQDREEAAFVLRALDALHAYSDQATPTILVAPPRMLGVLRASRSRLRRILAEIDKDWTHLTSDEIADLLQQRR